MSCKSLLFLTLFYILLSHVASSDLAVRNLPGKSSGETIYEVRRRLASRAKRDNGTNVLFDNSTSFSMGLDGVTIFKYPFDDSSDDDGASASINIICTKCYVKGHASAKITANASVNVTSAVDKIQDSFEEAWHSIKVYALNVTDTFGHILADAHSAEEVINDIEEMMPPPDIDFNLDLLLPDYNVDVNLTDLEVYMEIDTVLSAGITYTFNIYQSKTLAGVALGDGLLLGAVFSVDLIFSVNGQIDIQSGFHIHFDNVRTQIALFGIEASKLDFDGGKFAFLPVILKSGELVLQAVLRLEARIGIEIDNLASTLHITLPDGDGFGAGVEARIYANIAEFVTNVTLGEVDSLKRRDDDCKLSIAQEYTFGVGAGAGASLVVFGNTWGPTPETEIPIFFTTLAQACIIASTTQAATISATTAAASQTSAPGKRAESQSVTSTVLKETQTAIVCASSGLINCPASLQSLTKNIITKTLTSTITSGGSAVWTTSPPSSFKTVDFPATAVKMTSSSGKPKSYTPPPPPPPTTTASSSAPTDSDTSVQGGQSGKHRVSNAVIIGVSVGLGVPVLLAAVGAFIYFFRRNRRTSSILVPASTEIVGKAQPVVTTTYMAVPPEDDR